MGIGVSSTALPYMVGLPDVTVRRVTLDVCGVVWGACVLSLVISLPTAPQNKLTTGEIKNTVEVKLINYTSE